MNVFINNLSLTLREYYMDLLIWWLGIFIVVRDLQVHIVLVFNFKVLVCLFSSLKKGWGRGSKVFQKHFAGLFSFVWFLHLIFNQLILHLDNLRLGVIELTLVAVMAKWLELRDSWSWFWHLKLSVWWRIWNLRSQSITWGHNVWF
jgi:hypothetical protein